MEVINLKIDEIKIGMEVAVTYCNRLVGVVGKPIPIVKVTKIGRKIIYLSNNMKISIEDGFFGIVDKKELPKTI